MKNKLLAALGLAALAGAAFAADVEYTQTGTRGEFLVSRGYSTVTANKFKDLSVYDNGSSLTVSLLCGTAVSVSLITKTSDGQVLGSQTVACSSTAGTTTYTAPLYFEKLSVSPTTAVSATAGVTTTVIETK